jgi:hypothetical protein
MAHHRTAPSLPSGFRRRFPLELSPDEYEALEAAGTKAGSKRAALLAGLAALSEHDALSDEAARMAASNKKAQATITALEAKIAELERTLAETNKKAAGQAARARKAAEEAEAEAARATKDAQWADDLRESERETRENTQAELDKLDAVFVDELRCPRCGGFAPPGEWATQRTDKGRLVYHKPCGYHQGGLLDETSVLGRRTGNAS